MRRKINQRPVVSRAEIFHFMATTAFTRADTSAAFNTELFTLLKDRYNGVPVLERYTCADNQKMGDCIHWFGLEAVENTIGNITRYSYINYNIDPIIFSLLSNSSLQSIATIDGEIGFAYFDNDNNDIVKFDNNKFEEIMPYKLDGELTGLALDGSVYVDWEYPIDETKKMADELVNAIIGQRYEDFKIYKTTHCWSGTILGFFVAYFIFDEKQGEFWIFSKDDFD